MIFNMKYRITDCAEKDAEYICDRLVEYNLSQVPQRQEIAFESLDKKLVDDSGNIIAGIVAKMYCWNVVYLDILWVGEEHRGEGLGTYLLKELEQTAKSKGATLIHLDTFDFQAKDFYIKNGYELFGTLDECPQGGHSRYYFKKYL